jgi:hypothetical protein
LLLKEDVPMKARQFPLLVALVSAYFTAANVEAASISVSIDGASVNVPVQQGIKPNGQPIFFINTEEEPFVYETANGRVILGGALDPDPSIIFGGLAFDFGAPSIFGLTFVLPLAPTVSNPSFVRDSFSGSVTNGPPPQLDGGVTVTALPPLAGVPVDADGITEMEVYTLSDDGGVTWKNVGLDLGPSATIPLAPIASGLYPAFNAGPIATIPGGPWTHMRADVSFMLSGGGDIFTFNGAKILVPEPGTLMLAVLAVVAVCGCRRRMR